MSDEPQAFRSRVSILILARMIMALVLLAAFLFYDLGQGQALVQQPTRELVYATITGLLLLCGMAGVFIEKNRSARTLTVLAYLVLVADGLFASVLVMITGGTDSVFTFLYSLVIVNAALLLYRKGSLFSAGVNSLCLLMLGLGQAGLLGPFPETVAVLGNILGGPRATAVPLGSMFPHLLANILAFFAIAVLASLLAERIRRADLRAEQHREGFEALANVHETIVASLENGLITTDLQHKITYVNQVVADLLGRSAESLDGQDIREVFPGIPDLEAEPTRTPGRNTETEATGPDGRKRHLRWTESILRDPRGEDIGHVLMFFDNTRIREMEVRVQRAERLAAMGRMAASIAHEIRNPLASMSGSIQLMADSLPVDDSHRKLMDIVVRQVEHLNGWITDFLDYTRPKPMERERLDLARIVEDALAVLRNDRHLEGIELILDQEPHPFVAGDRRRLTQVVYNLVLNAAQAVGARGIIRLKVAPAGHGVEFSVRDNGPGVPPEHLTRIFEPFYTTKPGGTGLGLATVYRNVEDHDGSVHVHSDPESRGATFTVYLPGAEGRPASLENTGEFLRSSQWH